MWLCGPGFLAPKGEGHGRLYIQYIQKQVMVQEIDTARIHGGNERSQEEIAACDAI